MILALVGTSMQLVDYDLFTDVHHQLAECYLARGLRGDELDNAICRALPDALEAALHGGGTVH